MITTVGTKKNSRNTERECDNTCTRHAFNTTEGPHHGDSVERSIHAPSE